MSPYVVVAIVGVAMLIAGAVFYVAVRLALSVIFDSPAEYAEPPDVAPTEIIDSIQWWDEVWGPEHPHVPDMVVTDAATGVTTIYDWKTEASRTPAERALVGRGRGRQYGT